MMKKFLPGALICVFVFLWVCVAPVVLTISMQPSFDRQFAASTAASAKRTAQVQLRATELMTVAQSAPLATSSAAIVVSSTLTPEPDPTVAANQRVQEGGNWIFILLAIAIIGSYIMTDGHR
jgi:hypothetical protein